MWKFPIMKAPQKWSWVKDISFTAWDLVYLAKTAIARSRCKPSEWNCCLLESVFHYQPFHNISFRRHKHTHLDTSSTSFKVTSLLQDRPPKPGSVTEKCQCQATLGCLYYSRGSHLLTMTNWALHSYYLISWWSGSGGCSFNNEPMHFVGKSEKAFFSPKKTGFETFELFNISDSQTLWWFVGERSFQRYHTLWNLWKW